jgi:hypothetical protein
MMAGDPEVRHALQDLAFSDLSGAFSEPRKIPEVDIDDRQRERLYVEAVR